MQSRPEIKSLTWRHCSLWKRVRLSRPSRSHNLSQYYSFPCSHDLWWMRMNRPTAFEQSIFIKGTITSFYRWGKLSPLSHTAEMRKRQDSSVGESDTQAEHDFTWFRQKHKRWEKTRTPFSCGARWVRMKAMSFGKQHYQIAAKTQA